MASAHVKSKGPSSRSSRGKKASDPQAEGRTLDASRIGGEDVFYCAMPAEPERLFSPDVTNDRAALIRVLETKWVNGTVLHYYFFDQETDGQNVFFADGSREWRTWTADEAQKDVVREGFKVWKDVGIGLEFKEVSSRTEAEIRIGFMQGDGAWSYLGRRILDHGPGQRTMNFGWDLTRSPHELDTAVHEIGHTLGFPHEHQNPNSGIVWDEEAVYAALAKEPNFWSKEKTYYNIIRKLDPDTLRGSNWDPDSVMHYPFAKQLIKQPERYYNEGLKPAGGLSQWDKAWVKEFYPPLTPQQDPELKPLEAVQLALTSGEQKNFVIKPAATREYSIRLFGVTDSVMVLFEDDNGELRYQTADDDSGEARNAELRVKLFVGRRYILRVRRYHSENPGDAAIMMW